MAIDTRSPRPMAPATATVTTSSSLLNRVHWGAIFAGALSALGILIVLNLLGLAVGLYVLEPAAQDREVGAATTTAGVWWAISALAALFAGGWVAGRLAGVPIQLTAALHGLVVWAIAVIAAVWLVTSTTRAAFGGAASLLGSAGQAALGAAGDTNLTVPSIAVEPALNFIETDLAQEVRGIPQGANLSEQALQDAAQRVVAVTIDPQERQELQDLAASLIRDVAANPGNAPAELQQRINAVFGGNGVIDTADRQEAARVLASELDISVTQARQTIDIWADRLSQAGPRFEQEVQRLQTSFGQAAEETVDTVANTALWTAIGLLLALAAAVWGGLSGRPDERYAPEVVHSH